MRPRRPHLLDGFVGQIVFAALALWLGSVFPNASTAVGVAFVTLLGFLLARWTYRGFQNTRRWRQHNGLCVACGYDLRATPERCPECGGVTQPAASAAST